MSLGARQAWLLIARNLRAGERTLGLFRLRASVVVVVLIVLWFGYGMRADLGSAGLTLLATLIECDYWLLVIAGISLFPTLIAEEREQRTLSLLRLAGFGPAGFLLGQSLSAFAASLLVLAVQVPFLLLAVALGGTSPRRVLLSLLVLCAHAVLVYGVAVLAGAVARTTRAATRVACLLVPLVTFLPGWLTRPAAAAGLDLTLITQYMAPALMRSLLGDTVAGELARGVMLHFGLAIAAGLLALLLLDARGEPVESARSGRTAARGQRQPRFPTGPAAFAALAARITTSRLSPAVGAVVLHASLATMVFAVYGATIAGLARLMAWQIPVALLHAAAFATRCTLGVRRERIAGLLLLAGGPHTWLDQQRQMRMRTFGVHLIAQGIPALFLLGEGPYGVTILAAGSALAALALAGYFIDRLGERCGVRIQRAPLAVTVLAGGLAASLMAGLAGFVGLAAGPLVAIVVGLGSPWLFGSLLAASTVRGLPKLYAE